MRVNVCMRATRVFVRQCVRAHVWSTHTHTHAHAHTQPPTPQPNPRSEEDAKRRTLLRYVNAVKASAVAGGTDPQGFPVQGEGGVIQLPESGITDEEVHAIAALLRGQTTIAGACVWVGG